MTDEAWFAALFERDYDLLYRVGRVFCGRESLIEDQIQEAFLRAWQKRAAHIGPHHRARKGAMRRIQRRNTRARPL